MASERLQVVLELVAGQYKREAKAAASATGQIGDSASKAGTATTGMTKSMSGFTKLIGGAVLAQGARQLAQFGAEALSMATDAAEAASAFSTSFGAAEDDMQSFVTEFAHMAGFTESELQQLLAVTGSVVQGIGATEAESARLSEQMARLAGDVASFTNASGGAEDVLRALQSAINGEREALKTYGLALSEAEVQQAAMAATGKTSADELTRLEKAQATVTLAYEKAAKASGDLARTQDSDANRIRNLAAQWREAKTAFGEALLPIQEAGLDLAEDVLPLLAEGMTTLGEALADVGPELAQLFSLMADGESDMAWLTSLIQSDRLPGLGSFQTAVKWVRELGAEIKEMGQIFAGERDAANLTDILDDMFTQIQDGIEPARALDEAVKSLLERGSLTENTLTRAIEESGLAGFELLQILSDIADSEAFSPEIAARIMAERQALLGAGGAAMSYLDAIELANKTSANTWTASRKGADGVDILRKSYDSAGQAIDSLIQKQDTLADRLRAASDPIFGAVDAWQAALEAQQAVDDATDPTIDQILDLASANQDLEVALSRLRDQGQFEAGMDAIASAAGVSRDELDELLATLIELRDGKWQTTFTTSFVTVGTPPSMSSGGGFLEGTGLAHGGSAMAGSLYQVGENNRPELFMIPGDGGRVFSNSESRALMAALGAGGTGGGNLTINMQSIEPGLDAQRVGAMATIQRIMET